MSRAGDTTACMMYSQPQGEDTFASIDDQLAAIDDQMTQVQAQRALRTRRNAITPFCRLPSDILLRILYSLIKSEDLFPSDDRYEDEDEDGPVHSVSHPNHWIGVTGVCNYIRTLALASPLLWSHIDLNNGSRWIDLLIRRSESSLLDLSYHGVVDIDIQDKLSTLVVRAQNASIVLYSRYRRDGEAICINDILNQSLPSLCSLLYVPTTAPSNAFQISRHFLGGMTSSLTRLVLHNICITTNDLALPSLIHLDLGSVTEQSDSQCLLQLIENSPQLERLYLTKIALQERNTLRPLVLSKRLTVVQVVDFLCSIGIAMQVFPIPQQKYVLSVIPPDHTSTQPETIALRTQVTEAALQLQKRINGFISSPTCHLSVVVRRGINRQKHRHFLLGLQRPDDLVQKMAFIDSCRHIGDYRSVWNIMKVLHIHGQTPLFRWARENRLAADSLSSIEHLVIEAGDEADWASLKDWLSSRATTSEPLQTLDFKLCKPHVRQFGLVPQLGRELIGKGFVREVLEDGHPI